MFTGIVETLGTIKSIKKNSNNLIFTIESTLTKDLKIDQSVAHNGVCLTVVEKNNTTYKVVAVAETLNKTSLQTLVEKSTINLERAMLQNARLDGHIVQGHVDQTAIITKIEDKNGSWNFYFKFNKKPLFHLIDKGSICIDGTSLTVVKVKNKKFQVTIIPYTFENTIFKNYKIGTIVNIEFDILGKYIEKMLKIYKK